MGNVTFFLRYALLLFVMSLLTLFFVEPGTLEFKVTLASAVASFLVSAASLWVMKREEKEI